VARQARQGNLSVFVQNHLYFAPINSIWNYNIVINDNNSTPKALVAL